MHFNITKPQSNDYFSLGVMNDNYDEIDDVMYANQQSAAKVMVGATSLADGESGRVPAPAIADKDKYLKGDGTWDTPSGGGGGGSTVTITPTLATGRKIAEYEIDGTNGSLFAPLVEITGSASGSIATFTDGAEMVMPSLTVGVEAVQDLHGYDSPWVGGAGKNKFDFTDTTITSSRTIANDISLKAGDYIVAFDIKNNSNIEGYYQVRIGTTGIGGVNFGANYSGRLSKTFTLSEDSVINIFVAGASSGYSFEFSKGQIELGSTATSFAPYSNICPISGHTKADVTVTDDLTTPTETHTTSIPFHDSDDNPITVYGGMLNVTSGELRVTHANIASYNGETINEPWISSMDVYSAGATPTTGAQVVYPLTTPLTYQLTPTQVTTLLGMNNLFADCGDVNVVVYVRDINLAFNQLEARVAALEGNNSRSVSLTKSAPIEETKEEEPNEVKEEEEKR